MASSDRLKEDNRRRKRVRHLCQLNGWLHNEVLKVTFASGLTDEVVSYVFPSTLHREMVRDTLEQIDSDWTDI